jgi:hypothetical protein
VNHAPRLAGKVRRLDGVRGRVGSQLALCQKAGESDLAQPDSARLEEVPAMDVQKGHLSSS